MDHNETTPAPLQQSVSGPSGSSIAEQAGNSLDAALIWAELVAWFDLGDEWRRLSASLDGAAPSHEALVMH